MFQFYIDGLLLPVTPEKMTVKVGNQNDTLTLISGQEVSLLKLPGLSKISFGALLPVVQYPFAQYPGGVFQSPLDYLGKLETLKQTCKPFLFQVVRPGRFQTSFTVSLEDYTITEDASKHGQDVYVDVTLLQYQAYVTKTIQFKNTSSGTTATVSQPSRDTTGKKTTTSYTVKSGDTLWNIAKKYLGSGAQWKTIYDANKATIEAAAKKMGRASSSNGHWIYPGTVLVIPSSGTTATTGKTQTTTTTSKSTAAVGSYQKLYTSSDATVCAKIMYNEGRGLKSKTELACIVWTILNRVDAGYGSTIQKVALAKNQFAYTAGAKTTSDYGYDLVALAKDVMDRWSREKAGQGNIGRVLPKGYTWYYGDGKHNYFFNNYQKFMACVKARRYTGGGWNYSLKSPY